MEKEQSAKEMLLTAGAKVEGVSAADVQKLAAEFEKEYNANQQRALAAKAIEELSIMLAAMKYRLTTGEQIPMLPDEKQQAEVRPLAVEVISQLTK